MEMHGQNRLTKEIGFGMQHPFLSAKVGSYNEKGTNISSVSAFFAINLAKKTNASNHHDMKREQNALRHAIWQGIISYQYGETIAERIANAHEDKVVNADQRLFMHYDDADTVVDLYNNRIGRTISKEISRGIKGVVESVLNEYHNNGLWFVENYDDGSYRISRRRLSDEEYQSSMDYLSELNNFGHENSK